MSFTERNNLLPPSASQLENDLLIFFEQWLSRVPLPGKPDKPVAYGLLREGEIPVRLLWNPALCPEVMLPYLACALSVDDAVFEFTTRQIRNAIPKSVSLHKKKGTVQSVIEVVEALEYTVHDVVEGVDNSWWKYSIVILDAMSRASGEALKTLIMDVAPVRCELVNFTFSRTHDYSGYLDRDGKVPGTDAYDFLYDSDATQLVIYQYGVL